MKPEIELKTALSSTAWDRFLAAFWDGIGELAARTTEARHSGQPETAPVMYVAGRDRKALIAKADEILIGVGKTIEPVEDAIREKDRKFRLAQHRGVCLNPRGVEYAVGRKPFGSVAEMVIDAPPALVDAWSQGIGDARTPRAFFQRFTLGVEDASPDSCLGLVLLLAKLNSALPEPGPMRWIDYVRRWEAGYVGSAGDPSQSYGALHNALVHSRLQGAWAEAWADGLRLLVAALRSGTDPARVSDLEGSAELEIARTFLENDRQAYVDTLDRANQLQLSVPLAGPETEKRWRLIDAFITTENSFPASLKAFSRTDKANAYLRGGFSLMAVNVPAEEGTGDDMSVSVSKESGIHLRDLWKHLEALEDERWEGKRPTDNPRTDLQDYPGGRRRDGSPAPNEPWYDGRDFTLVAAPRRLGMSGPLGSKLRWADVCEVLWNLYNPYACVDVMTHVNKEVMKLADVDPGEEWKKRRDENREPRKPLVIALWNPLPRQAGMPPRAQDTVSLARITPTLTRYLGACVARWDASGEDQPIRLEDLPSPGELSVVPMNGGFAVVSQRGAYVIGYGPVSLNIEGLRGEFKNAISILETVETYAVGVGKVVKRVQEYAEDRRLLGGVLEEPRLVEGLSELRIRLMQKQTETTSRKSDPDSLRFRDALLERWGIQGRLNELYSAINEVSAVLRSRNEQRFSRSIQFLTLYGFPLGLVTALFNSFHFKEWDGTLRSVGEAVSRIQWSVPILYVVMALLAIGLLHVVLHFYWKGGGRRSGATEAMGSLSSTTKLPGQDRRYDRQSAIRQSLQGGRDSEEKHHRGRRNLGGGAD